MVPLGVVREVQQRFTTACETYEIAKSLTGIGDRGRCRSSPYLCACHVAWCRSTGSTLAVVGLNSSAFLVGDSGRQAMACQRLPMVPSRHPVASVRLAAEVSRRFQAPRIVGRNLDRFSDPGVAAHAGLTVLHLDGVDPSELDAVTVVLNAWDCCNERHSSVGCPPNSRSVLNQMRSNPG